MQKDFARRNVSRWSPAQRKLASRQLRIESLEDRNLLAGVDLAVPNLAAALADDAYEQNDTFTAAKNLGTLSATQTINNLVQADAHDWYRFNLSRTAGSSGSVSIAFAHTQGDLDLELYSSTGSRLRVSQGIKNSESISLSGLAAGTYYVHVYGYRGVTNPKYSLAINPGTTNISNVVTPKEDPYENNDTRALASNLGTLSTNANLANLALLDSADWFRFTTTAKGTTANTVSISFQNAQGNLGLQLVNASGTVLATANGTGNKESISLANRASGTYFVRVFSATGATNPNYSLQIIAPTAPPPPPTPAAVTGAFNIQLAYTGFTASQRAIFEQAAARWESVIVGDLPNAIYNGVVVDVLLINASATAIDGVGGTLGQAGYDRTRTTGTRLPYHGMMEFDTADLAAMEANGSLLNVIVHEIGHVLGFGTLWQSKGLIVGAGTSNPLFTGRQAVAAYNAMFGTAVTGVPVENGGGGGTRDSHWRESAFNNELMTGYIDAGFNPLSRVTLASFADLGYTVNFAAADPFSQSGSSTIVPTGSSASGIGSNLTAGSAISAEVDRFPGQATNMARRNSAAAAVFAWIDQIAARNTRSAAPAMETPPVMSFAGWSAAVDLLFAGETDLDRLEVG